MRLLITSLVAVAGFAGTAAADFLTVPANAPLYDAHNASIQAAPIGSSDGRAGGAPQYSSIPGPYSALAAASFSQRDDYTSIHVGGQFEVDAFRFVGGVTAVGGILDFFFLDNNVPTPNVISAFAIAFPQAGNFIWTITFNIPDPIAKDAGQLQIQTRGTTTGQWFATTTAAAPGSNSFQTGYGSTFTTPAIGTFEMQIPAPSSLALLGLGGLVALRRRR